MFTYTIVKSAYIPKKRHG